MKLRKKLLLWTGSVCLIALAVYAANPSFNDFDPSVFAVSGHTVSMQNPLPLGITGNAGTANLISDPPWSTITFPDGGTGIKYVFRSTGPAQDMVLYTNGTVAVSNLWDRHLIASAVVLSDATTNLTSLANSAGVLTNDGAGNFSFVAVGGGGGTQGGVQTNSVLQATNIIGIHDSICIPASAFYSFNLSAPASVATLTQVTNLCSGWTFADSVTNEVRARFALPYDWDGNAVKVQLTALCTGTNSFSPNQTNVVWGVAAAALPTQLDVSSQTFGTQVGVTNPINRSAWVEGNAVVPVTVGNSPDATKSILWQIQRLGAATGDTLTNSSLVLTEVRIFFTRNLTTTNNPANSP